MTFHCIYELGASKCILFFLHGDILTQRGSSHEKAAFEPLADKFPMLEYYKMGIRAMALAIVKKSKSTKPFIAVFR